MKLKLLNTTAIRAPADSAGDAADADTEVVRKKIANRLWITADGREAKTEEEATGVSYEFLGRDKAGESIPADGKAFTRQLSEMSEVERNMCALFGALTLYGNVTNTWMGEKGDKPPTAYDAIAARVADLHGGIWVDRTGQVGAKVDVDALTEAVCRTLEKAGKPFDKAAIRAKMESPENVRSARQVPQVAAEYAAIMGRTVKTVDELASAFA